MDIVQNMKYMYITCHFFDCNWVLNKEIIKLCLFTNHEGETIAWMLESSVIDCEIDWFLIITVDNVCAIDVSTNHVRMSIKDKEYTIMWGEFLYTRFAAPALNFNVWDGLKHIYDRVTNIRNVVRFVKSSLAKLAIFKNCAKRLNIKCRKIVCPNVLIRWNSTYQMLNFAEKYKKSCVNGNGGSLLLTPKFEDWQSTHIFIKFLKFFFTMSHWKFMIHCIRPQIYYFYNFV